jgi:peptidoglycan/LPS O-acetylase OafA/YrhL
VQPSQGSIAPRDSRNHALDGVRGLAAMSVALGHCVLVTGGIALWGTRMRDFPAMPGSAIELRLLSAIFPSDAAVMVFFVLSGHVLWESFRRKQLRLLPDIADFVHARLFRLLPLTIVTALPLGFLMDASARALAMNMLLLSDSLNGVLWSLQVEMVGSVALFILWGLTWGSRWKVVLALCLVAAATPFCRGNPYVVFLPAFILGALISSWPGRMWHLPLLLPAGIVLLVLTNIVLGHGGITRCFEIVGATVVVGAVANGRLAFLSRPLPLFLGAISYPFYLVHPILLTQAEHWLGHSVPGEPFGPMAALAVVTVTPAIPIAWLLHVGVEMPAMRARPRLAAGRRQQASSKPRGALVPHDAVAVDQPSDRGTPALRT